MNIFIDNQKIQEIKIISGNSPAEISAAEYLSEYSAKLGLVISDSASFETHIVLDDSPFDSFSIKLTKTALTLSGGKRGIIYSVFSFLEMLGCRFFTPTLEILPEGDVYLPEISKTESSPFEFRDVLSNGATNKVWSLKHKLNSNLWNTRKFTEADGDGYIYAGIPAHSLTGEFLLKPFVESNPEYFSLVNGVRHTDRMGQICMTNENAIRAAAAEACRVLRENPGKNIVDISQGDNKNFCQCDACQKAVSEQGLMKTYFGVICKIARVIKKEFPHVLVHTLAYEDLCKTIDFELEDNIMLQYCYGKCSTHAIDDESCDINKESAYQLADMCKKCRNVHVWHYTNCFKYELFEYPFIHNFRRNIKFFADVGVKGVFNEGMHRSGEDTDFATTMELRSYILAKLMWNPYMSEDEFRGHINEFCRAFYGAGSSYIVQYLQLFEQMNGECATYDLGKCHKSDEANVIASSIRRSDISRFITTAYYLLHKAYLLADEKQKYNIEKLRTTVLYFELYYTMDDVLENGTDDEKKAILAKNSELIDRIIEQRLVITFWGQFRESQNAELQTMRDISPAHWNYKW